MRARELKGVGGGGGCCHMSLSGRLLGRPVCLAFPRRMLRTSYGRMARTDETLRGEQEVDHASDAVTVAHGGHGVRCRRCFESINAQTSRIL